jgi:ABC-type Mn2+/Zn2+ transport system ATPase subunit
MMLGRVRLYDYRCFWREEPATLDIQSGLTSLIGPNNAGKSTLIKALYELRQAIAHFSNIGPGGPMLHEFGWNMPHPLHDHAEIVTDRDNPVCAIELEPSLSDEQKEYSVVRARLEFSPNTNSFRPRIFAGIDGKEIGLNNTSTAIHSCSEKTLSLYGGESFNVEALDFLAKNLTSTQYFGPFRNAINEGAGTHYDSQIGTGFINQWHQWKTGAQKSQNRAIERVTEDVRRLIGAKTLEINASNELKTLQVVIDKKPHKLQELGAGFSQLVVVLANALIRQPSFILIDEPELHLHPALQSDFLITLATYASNGILFTTHSMGLARLADNCYTVQRKTERSVVRRFERTPNYAEFLGSLGIAGLIDLGWDRILLVEGPKDVRTAQQLLRLYDRDRQTIVLPLGGDSMINGTISHELSEVRRLCNRVYALVDSERDSEDSDPIPARQKFARICEDLQIKCCVTKRRAIENYISQEALDITWNHGDYRALLHYDMLAKDGSFWGKGESWKAARHLTREEIDATDIGKFLAAM